MLEMKCRFRGAGRVGGGAAPPPAADHSHVKQVHVEAIKTKQTAPAGLFQHVAWFVASSLGLVDVLVGCLLWLLLNALVAIVVAVGRLLIGACWLVCGLLGRATEYGGLFCRRGSP